MNAGSLVNKRTQRYIREHLPSRSAAREPPHTSALVDAPCWADTIVRKYPWSSELRFAHTPFRNCQLFNKKEIAD